MKLHVISFDIPWPADYGGVIDVFNRLKALRENGVEVILHAFDYGRGPASELNDVCSEVHYYKRKNRLMGMLGKDPMIVASRASSELLNRLLQDDLPILFEGQHTTFCIDDPTLENRRKLVRVHNVEHDYYTALAQSTISKSKKRYYKKEAQKLKKHEKVLSFAHQLLCITEKDTAYYQKRFGNASYLPVAIECEVNSSRLTTKEPFILFHGNLSVSENEDGARWLLENVCPDVNHKFVFAGKNPGKGLKRLIANTENANLMENPSEVEMNDLIGTAKVHALYTSQSTGIKLKLLKALCSGSPIVCNEVMVEGTGLNKACSVTSKPAEFGALLSKLMMNTHDKSATNNREELMEQFSYKSHVEIIRSFLQ